MQTNAVHQSFARAAWLPARASLRWEWAAVYRERLGDVKRVVKVKRAGRSPEQRNDEGVLTVWAAGKRRNQWAAVREGAR